MNFIYRRKWKNKKENLFFKLEVILDKRIDLYCLYVTFAYKNKIP